MAEENPDGAEKTEDPTEERVAEFRRRGELALSRELVTTGAFAGVISALWWWAPRLQVQLLQMMQAGFEHLDRPGFGRGGVLSRLVPYLRVYAWGVAPICLLSAGLATCLTLVQTGGNLSWSKLRPNWQRLDPVAGMQRFVAVGAYFELVKSVVKVLIILTLAFLVLYAALEKLPRLMWVSVAGGGAVTAASARELVVAMVAFLLVVAVGDAVFQRFQMLRKMRMTKQEVREESKQREIDPGVRARMRSMQRALASRRTVEATRTATVLVTNPTHFSVALRYELGMAAPVVVAKGGDELALMMRQVAREADVPIVENKLVARRLYATTEVAQEIPTDLYKAVSEIILYVFRLRGRLPVGGGR